MENENYPFQKAWKQYRLWMRLFAIPIPAIGLLLLLHFVDSLATLESLMLLTIIVMLIALAAIYIKLMLWKCPRCGQFYFGWTREATITFAEKCKNCGLHKYEGSGLS